MNVGFGGTRYLITAPESCWGFLNGHTWCTKCEDTLRFVFVSKTESNISTIASYQQPKAIRCNCFISAGTKRAPIPLEVCPAATSTAKTSETSELVNGKSETALLDQGDPESMRDTLAEEEEIRAEVEDEKEADRDKAVKDKLREIQEWMWKQETESESMQEEIEWDADED